MYKKILVPLDGSPLAEEILDPVEDLAGKFESKVLLLRVDEAPLMLGYDEVIDATTSAQQKQRLRQMEPYLRRVQQRFQEKGIEAKYYIAFGPVVGTLLTVAEKEDVDLIALTSRGLDGSYRAMIRSVAARLLERVHRPMLLIRKAGGD
jgi:nucleotide-binding universal stress UspA family protein